MCLILALTWESVALVKEEREPSDRSNLRGQDGLQDLSDAAKNNLEHLPVVEERIRSGSFTIGGMQQIPTYGGGDDDDDDHTVSKGKGGDYHYNKDRYKKQHEYTPHKGHAKGKGYHYTKGKGQYMPDKHYAKGKGKGKGKGEGIGKGKGASYHPPKKHTKPYHKGKKDNKITPSTLWDRVPDPFSKPPSPTPSPVPFPPGCETCRTGCLSITDFAIVNADVPADVFDYTADILFIIEEGATYSLQNMEDAFGTTNFAIICLTDPAPFVTTPFGIGSVGIRDNVYDLHEGRAGFSSGLDYNAEGAPPYALADADNGIYNPVNLRLGRQWSITCQAFCGRELTGDASPAVTRTFRVFS